MVKKPVDKTRKSNLGDYLGNGFKKGVSGNPAGRPKGTKSKFSQSFYEDMLTDWQAGGAECIKTVRETDPSTYLRVAASILPKDINVNNTQDVAFDRFIEGLEDKQLDQLITGLCTLGSDTEGDEGTKEKGATKRPSSVH